MRTMTTQSGSGFTLIELLLGTVIFAVIILTVYSVFFAALKVQHQSAGYEETVYQMTLALESMARDLENAVAYNFANSYPEIKAFDGAEDHIGFIRSSAEGLQFVSYYLERDDKPQRHAVRIGRHSDKNTAVTEGRSQAQEIYQLVRETRPWIDGINASDENSRTRIVCRNVLSGGLRFAFGAMNPDSRERSWQPAWSFNVVPALIRMDLSVFSGGRKIELRKEVLNPAGTMIVQ